MTDTMMIVLGVLLTIFLAYVAVSLMLVIIMLSTKVYCTFIRKVKNKIAEYRKQKDVENNFNNSSFKETLEKYIVGINQHNKYMEDKDE